MSEKVISSHQNAKVKQIRALRQRKQREASGLFVVEGIHHVGEAAAAKAPMEYLVYSPELLSSQFGSDIVDKLTSEGVPCYETEAEILKSAAEKENPQGLVAVMRQEKTKLADLNASTFPWGVALVAPQDPGNLGTILRTIDAVGASGMIILDGGVDAYHPKAVRASMGSIFWHPLAAAGWEEFTSWIKENGYHLYGTTAKKSKEIAGVVEYTKPAILLLGSEREGLAQEYLAACEEVVRVRMHGRTRSLNLAVSAGILLYQMRETWDATLNQE